MESNVITKSMLSTKDNPFNPFEDFKNWFDYDSDYKYNSCGILDLITGDMSKLSPTEQALKTEMAIDSFINSDPLGIYIKVQRDEIED